MTVLKIPPPPDCDDLDPRLWQMIYLDARLEVLHRHLAEARKAGRPAGRFVSAIAETVFAREALVRRGYLETHS